MLFLKVSDTLLSVIGLDFSAAAAHRWMMNLDKFPEAFDRFEERVDVNEIDSFRELTSAFASWAGQKWFATRRQMKALAVQAREKGIDVPVWLSGFSEKYRSYADWESQQSRTSSYQRRIANYMRRHPEATLAEARGHRRKN